ncbi:hypothetical protein BJ982_000853 [Sphaerisporangium siamense]|uniref:HNH nuclease domain-containing protein n=2 Tax=Sphaerisporangium siamense TaxID=795645 RepID=A0A7W7G887_9ACTN|nr:hypothetical protein [Sphaerisporangium siamense]
MPHRPDVPCARCGTLLWRGRGTLPQGQAVCHPCRRKESQPYGRRVAYETRSCAVCEATFEVRASSEQRACSVSCARRLRMSPGACDDCGKSTTRRRTSVGRLCESCATARARARWIAKNHRRRTVGRLSDVTPAYERGLRARARKCPLCSVRLTSKADRPNSKHLDHILPIAAGGTHSIGNVRIICRTCNLSRPYDGSDLDGYQLTLWAQDSAFIPMPVRPVVPRCACGTELRKGRCWTCEPSRHHIRLEAGRRAAELRAARMKWQDIADELGLGNPGAAYAAARMYGDPDVMARWPQRYEHGAVEQAVHYGGGHGKQASDRSGRPARGRGHHPAPA